MMDKDKDYFSTVYFKAQALKHVHAQGKDYLMDVEITLNLNHFTGYLSSVEIRELEIDEIPKGVIAE